MHIREDFDSMTDFLDSIKNRPALWMQDSSIANSLKFAGTNSFTEAEGYARNGWPEGRLLMSDAIRDAAALIKTERIPARWNDVAGAYPDVQAAIAGDPLNMVCIGDDDKAQQPVVDFWCEISASSATKPQSIIARGAAILSWIDALEDAGKRVALTIINSTSERDKRLNVRIVIKKPDEPLDVDRLAYCMISPSMLRRHIFAWKERQPKEIEMGLYGTPESLNPSEVPANIIFFKNIDHGASPEQAAQAVRAIIAAGGLIDDET